MMIKKYMRKLMAFFVALLGLTTACGQKNFENNDVKGFAALAKDSNVVVLDVRSAEEYVEGHIQGAVLIDQGKDDFMETVQATLTKDKTIAVYCRSGRRSANAAGRLAGVGYKCVNLIGGIIAWKAAEMPVIKENNK